jgi:hypothetical protein
MECVGHNCRNSSDEVSGRIICVEPDDDGWICEPCWKKLTTGVTTSTLPFPLVTFPLVRDAVERTERVNDEYTTNPQTIRQRARERGIHQRATELDSVFIANQRARQVADIQRGLRNDRPTRRPQINVANRSVNQEEDVIEEVACQIRFNNERILEIIREAKRKPLSPFRVTALFILLIWFIIFCIIFCQCMYFG